MDAPMSSAAAAGANPPLIPPNGMPPAFMTDDPQFDIFAWHQSYQSCQRYFVDYAQHGGLAQTVASFLNIRLPFQWTTNPVMGSSNSPPAGVPGFPPSDPRANPAQSSGRNAALPWVSLVHYIRRFVVTGFDTEGVLHGFFGDDWRKGIGPIQECERRNYMFAAKSVGWAKVKCQYDISPQETVPFLRPLQQVQLAEIESAERNWSEWLAMEDWMVGPRAPDGMEDRPLVGRNEMAQDPRRS